MAEYTHEFSNFPLELIEKHDFRDVTDEVAPIINHLKSLMNQGLYGQAARYCEQNSDIISHYSVDSTVFNSWFEGLRNTQIYAKKIHQIINTDEDEPDLDIDDIWIGGD